MLHPNGLMDITDRSTGQQLFSAGPYSSCKAPYKLVMLANGQLVLQDKSLRIAWASGSACRGSSTCYTYELLDDGQLIVRDGANATVWTSQAESGSLNAAQRGWQHQITSQGLPEVSCIFSGPSPAAVRLLSQDRAYSLEIAQKGAALSLVSVATGTAVWSPQGALPGSRPAKLCIMSSGRLQLTGAASASLWTSSYPVGSTVKGPFTTLVTSEGCLEVVGASCQLLYSTTISSKAPPGPPARNATRVRPNKTTAATGSSVSPPAPRAVRGGGRPPPSQLAVRSRPKASSPAPLANRSRASPQRQGEQAPTALPSGLNNTSAAAFMRCMLPAGALCGGVQLCGLDQKCPAKGCCSGALGCRRENEYGWRCL